MENSQNSTETENKQDLNQKDFHEIVMKQYELINSQFNTIRQMQIDQEERDAEFDLSRLIPKFLRKKKGETSDTVKEKNKTGILKKLFNFTLLTTAKYYKLVFLITILGLIYGIIIFFSTTKIYESKIKYASGFAGNSFYQDPIENLGAMARTAPTELAKRLDITFENAQKIKNIEFSVFKGYEAEKNQIENDSVIKKIEYYPYFNVIYSITDNSIMDDIEQKTTDYLEKISYNNKNKELNRVGLETQIKDLQTEIDNKDSVISAAIYRIKNVNNDKNQYFIKETGLEGRGIILNQNEPMGTIIQNVSQKNDMIISRKAVLTYALNYLLKDNFSIVEHYSVDNNAVFPRVRHIVIYTLDGFLVGIMIAIAISIIKILQKKVKQLETETK